MGLSRQILADGSLNILRFLAILEVNIVNYGEEKSFGLAGIIEEGEEGKGISDG